VNVFKLILRGTRELGLRTLWHSFSYMIRRRWYQLRFGTEGHESRRSGAQPVVPGPVAGHSRQQQTVRVDCARGAILLTVLAPDLIRVRLEPAGHSLAEPFSYSIATRDEDWPRCDFELNDEESAVKIETSRLVCRVDRASGRLAFLDLEGNVISEDVSGLSWDSSGRVLCRKQIQPDEHFYGLGERTIGLDLRGGRYGMWNTDPRTYSLGQDPIHLCIPFLLGLHGQGQQGYGIFFDNTHRGHFDLGAEDPDVAAFGAEKGEMRYYFLYGPQLATVIERYTALTGRMQLPPLWMLGYHQSRWSYHPEARVRKLAADFRQVYNVPCDCIHLDIHYMDGYRCFTWNPDRFPDPARKIADLHAQGFKFITIIDPGIRVDPDYWVCQSGLEQDAFCKYPDGKMRFKGPVWPGDCYFPDFTDPAAREWWGELYETLLEVGVDGVWNDMNEPAVFGLRSTTMPDFVRHGLDGRRGNHAEAHNVYGMQMARATTEGLQALQPDRRPVCITRSGWAGVQRFAMSWTGDNRSNWRHLWLSMPMLMNLGLSGMANSGPDIGGYSGFASGELFTRWLQMGVFLPFLRSHTFVHSPDQEPWSWGEPYLSLNRSAIQLRYRLLPYLYTAFWQCAQNGAPIVRPLLLPFQDDVATHTMNDQFMCGDAFLVAPVVEEGALHRFVYLPEGEWYDFWSDERISGPAWIRVQTPLERWPVFVRAGAVVATAPPMQYVGERALDRLVLHVYPGQGTSLLYQDDGRSWACREGEFRLARFTLSSEGVPLSRLDLQRQVEGGCYAAGAQGFELVLHDVARLPNRVTVDERSSDQARMEESGTACRLPVDLFGRIVMEWE